MKNNKFTSVLYFPMNARNGYLSLFLITWSIMQVAYFKNFFGGKRENEVKYSVYVADERKTKIKEIPVNFRLNINQADMNSLKTLSVPEFLAERWLKYLEKGGKFRRIDDVKKLYGMSLTLYHRISGHLYVNTPVKKDKYFVKGEQYIRRCKLVDINEADSAEWESLYGIGPYLAQRIVTFRQSLCGFMSISQVKETYGLRDSVFQTLLPCLTLKKTGKPCISVNYSTQEAMSKHPYIRYKLAKAIFLYRENNGKFEDLEHLKNLPGINDSIYNKMEPYLTVDPIE